MNMHNTIKDPTIKALAQTLWDYHKLGHKAEKSDCILVLGSHDKRVAHRGAELYLQGFAPIIVFSGGLGNLTKNIWTETEAEKFAKIAMDMGVPQKCILIENRSTNTGENIQFSYKLLKDNKLDPHEIILVQKPYMERRTYATFMKQWPGENVEIFVTSPQISLDDYPTDEIPFDKVVNIMVGDLQRIKEYPEKGYQIYQEIPQNVWRAYEKLVEMGFTQHLIA